MNNFDKNRPMLLEELRELETELHKHETRRNRKRMEMLLHPVFAHATFAHGKISCTLNATFQPALGFKIIGEDRSGEDLVNGRRFARTSRFLTLICTLMLSGIALLCATAFAQRGAMSPYQGERDGVTAGGNWMEFQSEDKMSGAKRIRFELVANNYFREDPDYKPRVELFCEDGKLKLADFNPGVRLPQIGRAHV